MYNPDFLEMNRKKNIFFLGDKVKASKLNKREKVEFTA